MKIAVIGAVVAAYFHKAGLEVILIGKKIRWTRLINIDFGLKLSWNFGIM